MTIAELVQHFTWTRLNSYGGARIVWVNFAPGIWYASFAADFGLTDESYWIPDPATRGVGYVRAVLIDNETLLPSVASTAALAAEPSFFWDQDNRLLYIRLENWDAPEFHTVTPGLVHGFSDREVVYVDDLLFSPLLTTIPKFNVKQDLAGYDKPAFFGGTIELRNAGGDLDFLKDESVFGNDFFLSYLDDADIDDEGNASRSDLVYMAALYVKDYAVGMQRVQLRLKDRREADNIEIPRERFSADDYPDIDASHIGQVIPLVYGLVSELPATALSDPAGSGAVDYRVASTMTSLGTVYTKQDEVWTAVTPTASDASAGTFSLAEADARNANGGLYDCKIVGATGIAVTYASDIITDLYERVLGIPYTAPHFDTTEWAAEETGLATMGIAFVKPVHLFAAIAEVCAGASVAARFEFLPSGLRTIRLDDWSRDVTLHVPAADIENSEDLLIDSDTELIAADVVIEYAKSYVTDVPARYEDTSQRATVLEKFRQQPTLTLPTHLTSEAHAQLRAAHAIERYTDVHQPVDLVLLGAAYLGLRVLDIITVELGLEGFDLDTGSYSGEREFYGVWKAQVIEVNPDSERERNEARVVLIEEVAIDVRATTEGDLRVTTDGAVRSLA